MKKTIVRIIAIASLLLAAGAAPILASADSIPRPMCWPNPCSEQ
jgi:hypothetical protein